MSFVITATLMTYDIKQKYCHAVGKVAASQDKLHFSCQDLHAYFAGDETLTLKHIKARKKVRMDYVTRNNKIMITGPRAHFENRRVVFTHNPHVVITTRPVFPGVTDSSTSCIEPVRTGIQKEELDPGSKETLSQQSCQVFHKVREDRPITSCALVEDDG